jgi:uncharacterized protein YjbI with pentapeptide repeats
MQVKHRFTGAVLFDAPDAQTLRDAVLAAIAQGANLSGAYLSRANLSGADLSGAYLSRADLSRADLSGAYLSRANLSRADLSGADLSRADLSRADLSGAYLSRAYLSRANLSRADLSGADLSRADLSGADLSGAVIDGETITKAPVQVSGLRWPVLITEGYLRIGCQRHKHAEWAEFTPEQISDMSSDAPAFWAAWKAHLLALCEAHAK